MLVQKSCFKAKGKVEDLAIGKGLIGVGTSLSAQIFTEDGDLVSEINVGEEIESVSYKDDFYFLTWSGKLLAGNKVISLAQAFNKGLKVLDESLIACGKKCGLFDLSGNLIWETYIGWTDASPTTFGDYVYVADHLWKSLLIIRNGKVVSKVDYDEGAWSVDICGKTLAVTTETSLYLYRLENPERPKEILALKGFELAWRPKFSDNCKNLALLDRFGKELILVNEKGEFVRLLKVPSDPTALDWKGNEVVLGQYDGLVSVYEADTRAEVQTILRFDDLFYFHKHNYPIVVLPLPYRYVEVDGKVYASVKGNVPLAPFEGLRRVKPVDNVNPIVRVGLQEGLDAQTVVNVLRDLKVPLFKGAVIDIDGYEVVVEGVDGAVSAWPSDSTIICKPSKERGYVKVARVRTWNKA